MHRKLRPLATAACLALAGLAARADVTPYCPASPNSVGPGAVLDWLGPATPQQGLLSVTGLPAQAPLVFVYGQAQQQVPFGDGSLCVAPVSFILARAFADDQGHAVLDILEEGEPEDVRWMLSGLLASANFQVLYRDAGSPGAGFNASSALAVVFE